MRALALLLAILLLPLAAAQSPAPAEVAVEGAKLDGKPLELDDAATLAALQAFSQDVSGQRIHDCVQAITTDVPDSYRVMGTPTQALFLEKYRNVFGAMGLKTGVQHFTKGGPGAPVGGTPNAGTGGNNIVGVLPGLDLHKWVVMGGHYDTREETMGGGALDNASGMCTVTELARAMKAQSDKSPLAATVVFNWYDGEEWGLYGSVAFAQDLNFTKDLLGLPRTDRVQVLLSQSYDMPGLNYPAKNNAPQYGAPTDLDEYAVLNLRTAPIHTDGKWACWSYGCYESLKARDDFPALLRNNTNHQFLVREVAYDVLQYPKEYIWVYDDAYGRSDHIPLIAAGSPGMRIQGSHDEEYPHYHHATDTLPALYLMAGSKEALVAAYDTESRIGGTVADYVALTGSHGRYGDARFLGEAPSATNGTLTGQDAQPTPAPGLAFPLVALVAIALLRRRGNP
ncbi:MAG TPA: M28 family peptidase [Candidatus Thermoplasmatota archaeon]|nr:M28 family peptidase [Candidatus Thermoplasmatota archaeon]